MGLESGRVAIIGAGPSGLAALCAFEAARRKGAAIPELVCYEKQADWGGLWNYTDRTGLDESGEPVHGSMYRHLWSNGPKECVEFPDYTFEEHFGRPLPSFPPRAVLQNYLAGRAEKWGVRPYCRFNTPVRKVSWSEGRSKFSVSVHGDTPGTSEFDHVICAAGHFSTPNVPQFPGLDTFPGRQLHSHDFRNAAEFAGQDVLLIGGSYSAEDIALQCRKFGARSVTISWRTRPLGFAWPEGIREVPLLERLDGRLARFKDGFSREVDAIVLCTGYLHHFPYLDHELRLETRNRLYPPGLYKGVFWEPNPRLIYLGMQDQYYTFTMFDAQAWFARDAILGRITLPPATEREAETRNWVAREEALTNSPDAIDFQTDYVRDLLSRTDCARPDLDRVARLFKEWEDHKRQGILIYRDRSYPSAVTGRMAPPPQGPWMEALDDSLEAFLGPRKQGFRNQGSGASVTPGPVAS